jgi:hypothetical protein
VVIVAFLAVTRTCVTIAHYLGSYPARVLAQLGRSTWYPGPDLEVPEGSDGVTVVAR